MSVLATILSGNVEAQFVLSQLCVPVDSSPRSSLLPALLLLIRHIVYAGTPLCPISSLIPTTSTSPPASTGSATSKYNFNYETASSIPAQDADSEAVAGLALLTAFLGGNDAGRFGLVSHAVTPPPPAAIGLPDDATPPVAALQLAVSAIVSGAASLQSSGTAVGDAGTFTSPFGDRLASVHLTMTVCRACDVMRTVFGNDPTVKEIALRIVPTVGGKPLYDVLVGALAAVLQSGNPSSRSPPTTSTVLLKCSLLRLLGDWFDGFPPAVQRFFTDPSNLFLFDIASGGDPGALATPNALTSLGTRLPNLGACWLIALAFQNFAEDPKPPSSNGKRQPKPPVTSVVTSAGISIDRSTLLRMVSNRITVPVLMRAVTALDDAIRAARCVCVCVLPCVYYHVLPLRLLQSIARHELWLCSERFLAIQPRAAHTTAPAPSDGCVHVSSGR